MLNVKYLYIIGKGESVLGAKLKLNTTAECLKKLNEALLNRFFTVSLNDEANADIVLMCGDDKLEAAIKCAKDSSAAVLLVSDTSDAKVLNRCTVNGVLCCTAEEFPKYISPLYAMSVRLKSLENRTAGLKKQLDDSKLVNRAKMLLISRLGMSEMQAHKYIEKTAMDSCASKKDVAVRIIKTYED